MFKSVYFGTKKKKSFKKSLNLSSISCQAAGQEILNSPKTFNFRSYSKSRALPWKFNISGNYPKSGTDELFLFSPA